MFTGEYLESTNQGDYDFNRPIIIIKYSINIISFISLIILIKNINID